MAATQPLGLAVLLLASLCITYAAEPERALASTLGLWPLPKELDLPGELLPLDRETLVLSCYPEACSQTLRAAYDRFLAQAPRSAYRSPPAGGWAAAGGSGSGRCVSRIDVHVSAHAAPALGGRPDEGYEIQAPAGPGAIAIRAVSEVGALRALETLAQMVVATAAQPRNAHGRAAGAVGATEAPGCSVERARLWLAAGNVTDWPRVARRALLWDSTKATYLPHTPMEVVETMASSKLNVLYWLPLRAGVPEDTQREITEQAALRGIDVVMLSWAQALSAADYEAAAAGRADPQDDDPIVSYYDSDPDTDPLLDEEEREEAKELLEAEVVARDLIRRRLLFLDFLFGGGKDKGAQGAGDGEGRRMGGSGVRRSGGAGRSLIRGGGGGGAGYGDGEGAGGRKMVKKKKKMMKKKMKKKRKVLPSTGGGDDSFSDDDEDRERSSAQDLYRRRALLGQRLRYDQADDAEDAVDLEGEPYIQPAARGIRARASAVAATAAALRSESGYGSKAGARGAIRGPVSSSTQALDLLRAAGQAVVALDDIDGLLGAWPGVAVGAERLWASPEDGGVVEEEWTRPASAVARLSVHRCRMVARGVEVWRLGPLGPCPGEEAD